MGNTDHEARVAAALAMVHAARAAAEALVAEARAIGGDGYARAVSYLADVAGRDRAAVELGVTTHAIDKNTQRARNPRHRPNAGTSQPPPRP